MEVATTTTTSISSVELDFSVQQLCSGVEVAIPMQQLSVAAVELPLQRPLVLAGFTKEC
jgi:hypothetical protein